MFFLRVIAVFLRLNFKKNVKLEKSDNEKRQKKYQCSHIMFLKILDFKTFHVVFETACTFLGSGQGGGKKRNL